MSSPRGPSQVLITPAFMRIFPPTCPQIRVLHALASLILFSVMLPIKSVACSCPKGGKLMKRALIGGLSVLAVIVCVSAGHSQAQFNPHRQPRNTSGPQRKQPLAVHVAPRPN